MESINKFLNQSQDPKLVEKILPKIEELLTKNEKIEYIAIQKKPALNLSPDSIALTNKRIIFCKPRTLGLTMDFIDFLWKEIADCHISEGVMGAKFSIRTIKGGSFYLGYLPKAQARLLYRYGQEKEEEMIEYRRQRELEDARAKAGGGIVVNNSSDEKNATASPNEDPVANLKNLKNLLVEDLITQDEYDAKKKEILSKL